MESLKLIQIHGKDNVHNNVVINMLYIESIVKTDTSKYKGLKVIMNSGCEHMFLYTTVEIRDGVFKDIVNSWAVAQEGVKTV